MLRGLKTYTENITAIVSVSDDGGGSGVLREDLGMLPPGDIRNCITALANTEPTMMELMNYRFPEGINKGQSFGNLFLAALNGITGSFEEAVTRMNEVLAVTGKVLPVTNANVNLVADFENGASVVGESKIAAKKKQQNCRIHKVRLEPERPKALPHAIDAILSADMIILGPGSLYTSIIPNLLVDGIVQALEQSKAPKIYVLNIMTQDGETEGYTAFDHLHALLQHSAPHLVVIIPRRYRIRFRHGIRRRMRSQWRWICSGSERPVSKCMDSLSLQATANWRGMIRRCWRRRLSMCLAAAACAKAFTAHTICWRVRRTQERFKEDCACRFQRRLKQNCAQFLSVRSAAR